MEVNREIAAEILRGTGASFDFAEDGQACLDMVSSFPPDYYDLILMDIQMPVMDGYAATRAIRASQRADASRVRIIAMTANTFAEDISKARDAGMDGHLSKPIDIPLLMKALQQLV